MTPAPSPTRPDPDAAFLAAYDPSQYERLSVAVDVVLLTIEDRRLKVMLVRRAERPALGRWALPGGFVGLREPLDAAATRVLSAKAGLKSPFIEQLFTFGDPGRDPRTRVISVAYYALVHPDQLTRRVAADASPPGVCWAPVEMGPAPASPLVAAEARVLAPDAPPGSAPLHLAFDHARIIAAACRRIQGKLDYAPIGYELLPARFTLRDLQAVHETILGRSLNKDAFRRRLLASGDLEPLGALESAVGHRPAEFYRFRPRPPR